MRLLGVHRLHHRKGGAEGVHLDHLALFRENGWDVAEFAMSHPENEHSEWSDYFPAQFEAESGGLIDKIKKVPRFFYSAEAGEKFEKLLDDFKPDIIHAHGIYHHLTNAILEPALKRKIPIAYTLHDYKLICPAYHFYTEKRGVCEDCRGGRQYNCLVGRCTHGSLAMDALYALDGLYQWHSGAIQNAVSAFVGPCHFITEKFAEHGFDKTKLITVPNFFESTDDEPTTPEMIAEVKAKYGRFVLFFGRLSPEKGVDHLIRACRIANLPLVLVGDGPKRAEYEQLAKDVGATAHFMGYQKGAKLWSFVEGCTAMALPSVWYEIAPKSILEAQARGKPVVTTRIGGLPEMVEDNVTGVVVTYNDTQALAEGLSRLFAKSDAEIAAIGEAARVRATSEFTRQNYYATMSALYQRLLAGQPAALPGVPL